MRIYNTLSGRKEDIKNKKIGIYVCGPTVYDEPHIGHARSAYIFDVVVRYLKFKKLKVKFIRNVTDVDDKIIEKARTIPGEKSLVEKTKEISEKYLRSYHEYTDKLGLLRPDREPKATETIMDMVEFIKLLIKKGSAYEASGSVYFDVRKFPGYGKLSGQKLDDMEEGARALLDKNKKDPLDFALWKKSKPEEPSWDSPWGPGRPGWHLECSVMSSKFLGRDFLIHGGGLDLVFPHHENELAQSEAAGKKLPRFWMHNGLLTIDSRKMSKSLGNFISIKDFLEKSKDPDVLKLLFLSSHYRHPVDYTKEKITEMKRSKERIMIFLNKAESGKRAGEKAAGEIRKLKERFMSAMEDDFNTPEAIAVIFELVTIGNKRISKGKTGSAKEVSKLIKALCKTLGLTLQNMASSGKDAEKDIEDLIKERNIARIARDFERSDEIRDKLLEMGIILEDTKEGTTWRRKL